MCIDNPLLFHTSSCIFYVWALSVNMYPVDSQCTDCTFICEECSGGNMIPHTALPNP